MQPNQHSTLRRLLAAKGLIDPAAEWRAFNGGKTNNIWQVGTGNRAVVCKLFSQAKDTPLFPNSAKAEVLALIALAQTGIAPKLAATVQTAFGTCVIYQHVRGQDTNSTPSQVGNKLAQLHAIAPPDGLRYVEPGSVSILRSGDAILADLPRDFQKDMRDARPRPVKTAPIADVFLHGDPVPANIILTATGTVLIDWQCPAIGDPCADIAVYLSPAMQVIYDQGPLSEDQQSDFFAGYGSDEIMHRYRVLAPAFHWRMAAYCAWKFTRGDDDYGAGLTAELSALEKLT